MYPGSFVSFLASHSFYYDCMKSVRKWQKRRCKGKKMSANQNLCMSIQWLIITLRSDCSPRDTTSACSFWHYGRHVTAYDASLLMVILCWHIRGHVCAKMTTEICHVASCQKQAFKHKNLHQPKCVQGNLFFLWYPAPPLPHLLHHFHFI